MFITAVTCAVVSILALVALSAMTIAPAAEATRGQFMAAVAVFFIGWILLAFWSRPYLMAETDSAVTVPVWVQRTSVCIGAVYVLGCLLFAIG